MKYFWLLLTPFLTQCGSSTDNSKPLPVLSSPARASAWGSPKTVNTARGYQMTYTNPSNSRESVMIEGSRGLLPTFFYPPDIKGLTGRSATQTWEYAQVEGKKVRWYHSNAADATRANRFRVMGFDLKDSQGNPGNYRVLAQGSKNKMHGWFSELRLRR